MSMDQPPRTVAVGVPICNKEYYLYLTPGQSLELNIGEYDYGWYSCKCVCVKGNTEEDCAFIMEFDLSYTQTRFQLGWRFEDRVEQSCFKIEDNGRMIYYEGLMEKKDGFFMRETTKETSSFVTTAILKKQQHKDERGLELKDQITKRAKRDKHSILAIHNRLLSRSNDTLLHFFQTHELDGDKFWHISGKPSIKPTHSYWGYEYTTSERATYCVCCEQEIFTGEKQIDLYLKPWKKCDWVEKICSTMKKQNFVYCCHKECIDITMLISDI